MSFQGRLTRPDGIPVADGTYSIRFSLWDTASGGMEKWNQTVNPVKVQNGTFAVLLSGFPAGTFYGDLYLEIKIGTNAPLTPRQPMVSVAYALKADSVKDGAITSNSIVNGSITADKLAAGTLNNLGWLLGGNTGTNPASHFIGTTDNKALLFRTNNRRVLQMQYVDNSGYLGINVLGGYWLNSITAGVTQATVFGGGTVGPIDWPNRVTDYGGTVSGGINNRAGNNNNGLGDASYATVGGGQQNIASSNSATVGGGYNNTASGSDATVGGGSTNTASDVFATVGGGNQNIASNGYTTVGGGYDNIASGSGATVAGGGFNTASNTYATVAGGTFNTASGFYATVAGGSFNTASRLYSFAAGHRAKAIHDGAFVWADIIDTDFASTAANEFNVRASGGTRIFSNAETTTGVLLAPGGGSWSSASDRDLKTNFQKVDTLDVLEKLVAMPLTTWNYKANVSIRHIGPMAQDFYSAFGGLGMDDRHIDTIDADGVAFAAIQGLNRKLEAQNKELKQQLQLEVSRLTTANAELKAKNAELEARLERLEAALRSQK
jgi:trimeric autotransporter adhesin